ncbi:MAG: [citrate (pro-3S)-lyase] ligase [Eubacteriales bacterium]|nr:[citrate (pro-3S)-lyase] ligase [Eubacteriales bacterium]
MSDTLCAISPGDRFAQAQMDRLLEAEGIRRDRCLDYSCGIFDENEVLIATGSCFASTLRCLAVSQEHQGEGLLNRIIGHLVEVQLTRGNTHLFLYTKAGSAKFMTSLGFYEIARAGNDLVFMENRRNGFCSYCAALQKKRVEADRIAAIVMNANPFTLGHRYLVQQASEENDVVHLFLLSEEAGPIPHAVRRRLAEEGTAEFPNVVLHESGPYMISSATFPSYFLKDSDTVIRTQAALDLTVFSRIAQCLGIQRRYVGEETSSHVTALYNEIMAARLPVLGMDCHIVPRLRADGGIISASTVRQAIHDGRVEDIRRLVPESTYRYFTSPQAEAVRAAIRNTPDVIHY